jgi:hypothetical protein
VYGLSVEIKRPPLTTILLWIARAVTLVLTGYGIFSGVVLALPLPYNYLMVINSFMVGVLEVYVGALIDMHSERPRLPYARRV